MCCKREDLTGKMHWLDRRPHDTAPSNPYALKSHPLIYVLVSAHSLYVNCDTVHCPLPEMAGCEMRLSQNRMSVECQGSSSIPCDGRHLDAVNQPAKVRRTHFAGDHRALLNEIIEVTNRHLACAALYITPPRSRSSAIDMFGSDVVVALDPYIVWQLLCPVRLSRARASKPVKSAGALYAQTDFGLFEKESHFAHARRAPSWPCGLST